jgi:hypothetical protein
MHGIAQWYSAGLRAGWSGVRFSAGAGNFSLHHRVQTGSGTHPAYYIMGTRGSFPAGKAAGAWNWPLTSISAEVKECVELYLHSPNTRLHDVVLVKAQGHLYLYLYLLLKTNVHYSVTMSMLVDPILRQMNPLRSFSRPRPLYPHRKISWYPLNRRMGGIQSLSVHGDVGTRTTDNTARSPALYQWAIPAPRPIKGEIFLTRLKTSSFSRRYEDVPKSFRTDRLKQEPQMLQLSATRCSCIAILWISLASFAATNLCVTSQRVFIVVSLYFVMTQSGNFWLLIRICFMMLVSQGTIAQCMERKFSRLFALHLSCSVGSLNLSIQIYLILSVADYSSHNGTWVKH